MGAQIAKLNGLAERFAAVRAKGKRPRIAQELKREVLRALEAGASVQQVAASCGLNPVQVYHWRATQRRQQSSESLARKVEVQTPVAALKVSFPGGICIEAEEAQLDLVAQLIRRFT
jgi:transposase-like protein